VDGSTRAITKRPPGRIFRRHDSRNDDRSKKAERADWTPDSSMTILLSSFVGVTKHQRGRSPRGGATEEVVDCFPQANHGLLVRRSRGAFRGEWCPPKLKRRRMRLGDVGHWMRFLELELDKQPAQASVPWPGRGGGSRNPPTRQRRQ
jgi:hypothetical protein